VGGQDRAAEEKGRVKCFRLLEYFCPEFWITCLGVLSDHEVLLSAPLVLSFGRMLLPGHRLHVWLFFCRH